MIDDVTDNHALPPVLVLGATGLIGNAAARELVARGYRVTCTCRNPSGTAENLKDLDVRIVTGDIDTPGTLDEWIEGHEVVVDAAAPYPLHLLFNEHGRTNLTEDHAKRRTDRLVEALRRHDARLLYISTLMTRPGEGTGPFDMQRRMMRKLHPYFAIKATIERQLQEASAQLPGVIIVQPTAVVGPHDIKPRDQCVIPKMVGGEVAITIAQDLNVIDSRDLATGIAELIESGGPSRTVRLSGNNTSIDDIHAEIEALTGTRAPRVRYPAAYSVLPSYWSEWMWAMVGKPSPMPSLLPILLSEQGWSEPSEEQKELGVAVRPLRQTLADTIGWYRSIGYC